MTSAIIDHQISADGQFAHVMVIDLDAGCAAARMVHLPDDDDDDNADPAAEKTNDRRFPINPKPPLDLM